MSRELWVVERQACGEWTPIAETGCYDNESDAEDDARWGNEARTGTYRHCRYVPEVSDE